MEGLDQAKSDAFVETMKLMPHSSEEISGKGRHRAGVLHPIDMTIYSGVSKSRTRVLGREIWTDFLDNYGLIPRRGRG